MLKQFTRDELLDEWLIRHGYVPLRSDGSVDLCTGSDMRAWARRRVADRVNEIYATAPAALLPWSDFSAEATLSCSDCGDATVRLPAGVERVVSIRLSGWHRPAEPVGADNPRAVASGNPFLCGDSCNPLAIRLGDGTLRVMPAGADARVETLICVDRAPGDDEDVIMDSRLLASIVADSEESI
ncbi:MAG: hypothetical protein K2K40_07025 [Paramuribaculum sp.]|nr:hypothetical protein [Paramuribaculum sp.]